jgi:CheY-like chemotaxis protein
MNSASKHMPTILVVEDYEDVRQMLVTLLEFEEFRVLQAASGLEALNIMKTERPDIILMDLALPGFDGFETMRHIRRIGGFRNTPIVVLTACSGESVYEAALRAGADHFMSKPIDFDDLAALLKKIRARGNGVRRASTSGNQGRSIRTLFEGSARESNSSRNSESSVELISGPYSR